ncbi:MAG: DUF2812 domain-containing protein [Peptococcales bacterium]
MNFKIENNFLNISNYPLIERHLENMARRGWLISKIILGSIFIYKKINPEELDFSISPYEIETAFTKKSKEELDEFQSVCESVGWNYATKSYNLHVYFKKKGLEAIDLQTDDEEEFRTLESIGKRQLKAYYFQIPFLLFFSWMILGGIASSVHSMKDGMAQIVAFLIPIGLILAVSNLLHLRKFLRINRKNIEVGKNIEYSDSKFYLNKIAFPLTFIIGLIFIIYLFYVSVFLNNKYLLIALLPIFIGASVGTLYRIFIKPSKKTLRYKKVGFILTIAIATIIPIGIMTFTIIGSMMNHEGNSNIEGYKVLSINDFTATDLEDDGKLNQNASILIPNSYGYYSHIRGYGSVRTEYSRVLTEDLAINLVKRYKKQAENALIGRYSRELEFSFNEGLYDDYLLRAGFTIEDFNKLQGEDKDKALETAKEIIRKRSIVEDTETLWNVSEAYFLNYEKTEIVLRNGKEVFLLEGKDFSDSEIIKITKDKLNFN